LKFSPYLKEGNSKKLKITKKSYGIKFGDCEEKDEKRELSIIIGNVNIEW